MSGKHLEKEDIRASIHQHIRLMLKSLTLQYRFDPTFGSILNKYQAATPPQKRSERAWREEMREKIQKNLKDMLQRYESRIQVTDLVVQIVEPREAGSTILTGIRVEVSGELTLGRKEQFHYPDSEIDADALEVLPLMIPVGILKK